MNIEKFKPAIVYTIYIASTPEKVWEALTSAEFSRKYFLGNAVEVDLKVGGAFIVRPPDGAVHISGEVIECDPLRKLTVTFNVNWPALIEKLGPTLVTYEIEPAGDVVGLTLIQSHDRPISDDILSGGRAGLARDPLQPEEPAGDRRALVIKMAAAKADAGGTEGIGDRDAVRCRPANAGSYNPRPSLMRCRRRQLVLPQNQGRGVWVPAFAGRQRCSG